MTFRRRETRCETCARQNDPALRQNAAAAVGATDKRGLALLLIRRGEIDTVVQAPTLLPLHALTPGYQLLATFLQTLHT